MNKSRIVFLAALCVFGCRSFEESPVIQTAGDPSAAESEAFSITAVIEEDTTKVSMADNGYSLLWDKNDQITLFFCTVKSNGKINAYYAKNLKLQSGAGTKTAVFGGLTWDYSFNKINPLFAVYPAVTSPSGKTSGKIYTLASEYDNFQYVNGGTKNALSADFKATTSITGSYSDGFTCNFKEMGTLLDFTITPTDDMVKDGDKIQKISFLSASTSIAGKYSMSYKDDGSVSITPGDQIRENNLVFNTGTEPVCKQGETVDALMTILPGIKENEGITVRILTDHRYLSISAKAAKEYLSGYKYSMNLDLAKLEASGHLSVIKEDLFTKIIDRTGIFDISDPENIKDILTDSSTSVQYAYNGNTCRFQEWESGKVSVITITAGTYNVGDRISLTVKTIPSSVSSTVSANVVRVEGSRMWLKTIDGSTGYIINREG